MKTPGLNPTWSGARRARSGSPTDAISSVGGNRYGWFDDNEFPVLAYDNASLTVVPEPTALALLGLGAGALLLRRRRPA